MRLNVEAVMNRKTSKAQGSERYEERTKNATTEPKPINDPVVHMT